ncbi:HDOD domain-containing protein [Clostridium cellulovorans]|uniref:Stage 0 sporulation protein A homolog n=1 Tax=Clostridium cellulovorans (strain ATCC 35296 / DSM 3052 / OCM 3 / 743B) TaxID=573061 RepID=D9SQP5_CLOC7|nr:HDOD domain-containing protein [Clostridium cellulovorans]ADL52251.1 metal dependent phosphohydrolase [Clostridium cellulovorans 743B]
MNKSILFVDDEKAILNSIRREFFDSSYDTYFALGGHEALDILSDMHIDLLVTDMRMPEMDGYQLLKKVKELYPSTTRVILSGYTDENIVIKSIYSNLAKLFITKPWKKEDFRKAIDDVFKTEELLNNNLSLKYIKEIGKLPTIPSVLMKVNEIIEQEDSDINDIIKLIESDITISSQVLKIVNSAFYGLKTASIKKAVLNIGLVNLKTIITTSEVFNDENDLFNKQAIWDHSNLANIILNELYKKLLKKKIPEYYATAGLLHDIGKVAFSKIFNEEYNEIYIGADTYDLKTMNNLEREKFHISHEELGGYLLLWWDIPYAIVETTLYHHNPMLSSDINRELVSMVHIADYYAWKIMDTKYTPMLHREVFEYLEISEIECESIAMQCTKGENKNGYAQCPFC